MKTINKSILTLLVTGLASTGVCAAILSDLTEAESKQRDLWAWNDSDSSASVTISGNLTKTNKCNVQLNKSGSAEFTFTGELKDVFPKEGVKEQHLGSADLSAECEYPSAVKFVFSADSKEVNSAKYFSQKMYGGKKILETKISIDQNKLNGNKIDGRDIKQSLSNYLIRNQSEVMLVKENKQPVLSTKITIPLDVGLVLQPYNSFSHLLDNSKSIDFKKTFTITAKYK